MVALTLDSLFSISHSLKSSLDILSLKQLIVPSSILAWDFLIASMRGLFAFRDSVTISWVTPSRVYSANLFSLERVYLLDLTS